MGACSTFNFPSERVLFCFPGWYSSADWRKCKRFIQKFTFLKLNEIFSYSEEKYEEHPNSRYYHSRLSLGRVVENGKQYAVAIGGSTGHVVEYYDIKFKTWTYGTAYPSCSK